MLRLCVLTQKSEITFQVETNGTTRGKIQKVLQSLCHHLAQYRCFASPDLGYCGSSPWQDVAKILMDKYKCPERLVPEPPKNPEEIYQLLDKCKTL